MNERVSNLLEAHPSLAWIASILSLFTSWLAWFANHADDLAKIFGCFAAIFGLVAGYYTMRIQRRTFKRGETRAPFNRPPRD